MSEQTKVVSNTCDVCKTHSESLLKCEGCGDRCCENCLVEITQHNIIDFPFCKTCYEVGESSE